MGEFERRRELTRQFRMEYGRDPDDHEFLTYIVSAAKFGRKTWRWA